MRKIFVDFEMNPIAGNYRYERTLCSQEIIEFGAVMMDENNCEIARFREYVCPQFNSRIQNKITRLTGITWEDVCDKDVFGQVLARFVEWAGEQPYEIYAWSDSDLNTLRKEIALKEIPVSAELSYMLDNWKDFQKEYGQVLGLERKMRLADALELCGLDFIGQAHDGLDDARSTASIFCMLSDPEQFAYFREKVIDYFKPTTFTLSDLFDLSGIKASIA